MIRALAAAARTIRWPVAALGTCLLAAAVSAPGPASRVDTELPALGSSACPWPELSGRRLLDRSLGSVSFVNTGVWKIAGDLVRRYGVPISLVEASPAAKVTVALPSCTLRQLLDKIVAIDSQYRYGFFGSHLVLYSKDPKWQVRIENLSLISGTRMAVIEHLMRHLERLHPSLGHFGVPWYVGNVDSLNLQDQVKVSGPATVIELLTQVLGERPSAVFSLSTLGGPPPASLWPDTAAIVQSLEVTAPTATLHLNGSGLQLKVSAVLPNGERMDLTSGSCGTHYLATEPTIRVSRDGLVAAVAPGIASVVVSYENLAKGIALEVVPSPGRRPANELR
jgi:hypothetical protein